MPSNHVNWEIGGSHWDHFYSKRAEIESHAMTLGYAIGDMDFDYYNYYATTKIYLINQRRVRVRTVATIKTYYVRECTNTAHYLRLCQVLNYFDPANCHYYDKAQGWTTRPRIIGETEVPSVSAASLLGTPRAEELITSILSQLMYDYETIITT